MATSLKNRLHNLKKNLIFSAISVIRGFNQLLWRQDNTPKNLIDCFIYRHLKNTESFEQILYSFLKNHKKNHKQNQKMTKISKIM